MTHETAMAHLELAEATNLRRCPFCGGESELEGPSNGTGLFDVHCVECSAALIGKDPLELVRRWQRRIDADLLLSFAEDTDPPQSLRQVPKEAMHALAHWLVRE